MEIKRDYYLDKLLRKRNNGLIKTITGIRRSGKTYLLFKLFKDVLLNSGVDEDHIIEASFDSFEFLKYQDPEVFYPYIKEKIKDDKPYYLLFDEIQLLGNFEAVLNGLNRFPNVDIYVTGSNAKFLSKDIITEFRGRGDEIHLSPLSFKEFYSVFSGSLEEAWKAYITYGGLPPVVLLKTDEEKSEFLKNLITETYLNDIMGRHNIKNPLLFENVFDILASNIGSLTNANKISKTFESRFREKISYLTVKNYFDYLDDSFLTKSIKRYDVKGRNYINALEKIYFTDMGIRNAKLNWRQLEETHILENVVFNELISRGYDVDIGAVLDVEKDDNGKSVRKNYEIDFVCNKSFNKIYVQVALSVDDDEKLEQELRSLKKVNDSFKKVLITKSAPISYVNEDGIHIMNLFDFLLGEDL